VIFENNSELAAKSVKKTCGTGISLILRQFDIREEQGAPNCRNTERAFDELGGADWMVVCAVRYEPVSLLFGQYQGDFRK